jgi:polyphosphate kinase
MSDEVATFHLHPDDTWTREHLDAEGNPKLDLQQELINRQRKRLSL